MLLLPCFSILCAILFQVDAPYSLETRQVLPHIDWVLLLAWGLTCPGLLPPIALIALGYLQDTITSAPLGLSIVLYLSFRSLLIVYRKTLLQHSYVTSLAWMALLLASMHGIEYLAWSWVNGTSSTSLHWPIIQWMTEIVLYSPISITAKLLTKRWNYDKIHDLP